MYSKFQSVLTSLFPGAAPCGKLTKLANDADRRAASINDRPHTKITAHRPRTTHRAMHCYGAVSGPACMLYCSSISIHIIFSRTNELAVNCPIKSDLSSSIDITSGFIR